MNYTIAAKATTYKGINFRSRLEAKWAAMFDLLGWKWEYEPVDLDGWVPDFVLMFKHAPVYVEVKPVLSLAECHAHRSRIDIADPHLETILVGVTPTLSDWAHFGMRAKESFKQDYRHSFDFSQAWDMTPDEVRGGNLWDIHEGAFFKCQECRQWSINDYVMDWHCRQCGEWSQWGGAEPKELEPLWAEATNRTQYKNPNWSS